MFKRIFLPALFLALPIAAFSAGYIIEKKTISSGTGFFVNMLGNIVTNEHVVRNCKNITVQGSVDITQAHLIAADSEKDLAVLKINQRPNGYAKLRADHMLQENERVMIIGYPKERGVSGQYAIQMTSIISGKGPMGEEQWIQFADSAERGNSGGPLVDQNGNVIGVVRAKVQFYKLDYLSGEKPPETEEVIKNGVPFKSSDIAISAAALQDFLGRAAVPYDATINVGAAGDNSLEETAGKYIVNVHCFLD